MSDRGSWNVLLSHPASGAGCEISDEGGTSAGRNSGCKISGEDGTSAGQNSSPGGMSYARVTIRSNSIRIPPRGHAPPCYSDSLREKHMALVNIILRTIAYPIRICCPDHWLMWASLASSFGQPATDHVPPPSDGVSGRLVRTSFAPCIPDLLMVKDFKASILHVYELSITLPWIPKNSP